MMTRPPREEPVFYRSLVVRWTFIGTGLLLAWYFSPAGPPSRGELPSLEWLHNALPWPVLAAWFLAYVVLLATGNLWCIITADAMGLVAYLLELIALVFTIHTVTSGGHRLGINLVVVVAFICTCVLHYAAMRLAIHQLVRSRTAGTTEGVG